MYAEEGKSKSVDAKGAKFECKLRKGKHPTLSQKRERMGHPSICPNVLD